MSLYENEHYFVRSHHGADSSPFIVISFTGVGAPERHDGSFFGSVLARRLDIPWVGIVAKHDGWYRDGDYHAAFDKVRAWIATRRASLNNPESVRIVGYGISMGAYAAIKYSGVLEFDDTIAVAPQWSLDRIEAPYFSHFKHLFQPFMNSMGIRKEDTSGRIYVLYDPYEIPDRHEMEMLNTHVPIEAVPICYAGHMALGSVKGSSFFRNILNFLDQPNAFRKFVTSIRRNNEENIVRMIERSFAHRKSLAAKALNTSRVLALINTGSNSQIERLWKMAASLAFSQYAHVADTFFASVTGNHPTCFFVPRIMNWHGELLCYSHLKNEFFQTTRHVTEQGAMVTLLNETLFTLTPAGLIRVPNAMIEAAGNLFTVRRGDLYLSTRETREIKLVPQRHAWEKFTILPPRLLPKNS